VARHKPRDLFPAPLQEFVESEWPPVEGECLQYYACRGEGYERDCVPRPGEFCGQLCYESIERDYPGRPDLLERAKAADAYVRWRLARASWLGEDHPGWLVEVLGAGAAHRIRCG
jgi:hypothetical protein